MSSEYQQPPQYGEPEAELSQQPPQRNGVEQPAPRYQSIDPALRNKDTATWLKMKTKRFLHVAEDNFGGAMAGDGGSPNGVIRPNPGVREPQPGHWHAKSKEEREEEKRQKQQEKEAWEAEQWRKEREKKAAKEARKEQKG